MQYQMQMHTFCFDVCHIVQQEALVCIPVYKEHLWSQYGLCLWMGGGGGVYLCHRGVLAYKCHFEQLLKLSVVAFCKLLILKLQNVFEHNVYISM